jgi:hypothetical protein
MPLRFLSPFQFWILIFIFACNPSFLFNSVKNESRIDEKKARFAVRTGQLHDALGLSRSGVETVGNASDFFNGAAGRIRRLCALNAPNLIDSALSRIGAYGWESQRVEVKGKRSTGSFAVRCRMIQLPSQIEFESPEKENP